MEQRVLGNSGIRVSRLCFGGLIVGPVQKNLSPEEGGRVMAHAIRRGVTFFDTAQLYGTYPHIRWAMRETGRHDLVIASKTYAHTKELAKLAVEEARRSLDRDYIDIFLLHEQESIHTLNGHREALEYLYDCKARGVIRAVGLSTHRMAGVYGAIERGLDVVHPLLNMAGIGIADGSREEMERAVKKAHDAGIGVYGMKALGGGNLISRAEEALRYALGLDFLDAVAIGMQYTEEVDANLRFFETGEFSLSDRAILSTKNRRLHIDDWCTGCGACVARCRQGAMRVENGAATPDGERCVLCGYCAAVCPEWAIKIQ